MLFAILLGYGSLLARRASAAHELSRVGKDSASGQSPQSDDDADVEDEDEPVRKFKPFKPPWTDENFVPVGRQTDWCTAMKKANLSQGTVKALAGYNLSVIIWVTNAHDPFVKYDPAEQILRGGFVPEVLHEVSRRSGLQWHHTVAMAMAPNTSQPGHSNNDWLLWATRNYDVAAGIFSGTAERRALGLRFGFGFTDSSPVLVGVVEEVRPSVWQELFSWTQPFTVSVWLVIIGCFVGTAGVYYLLDSHHPESDFGNDWGSVVHDFAHSLFQTMLVFTGGGSFAPQTPGAKALTISWSFAVLLVVAAYTANLATFLIVNGGKTAAISGIADAIAKQVPICVFKGGAYDNLIRTRYPDLKVVYPHKYLYDNVRDGTCAAIVKDASYFAVDQGRKKFNPNCDLDEIGTPLLTVSSGFVTEAASQTCTDFLMNVLDAVMQDMYNDGWFDKQQQQLVIANSDNVCSDDSSDDSTSKPMNWGQMCGIFAMHFLTMGFLALMHCVARTRAKESASPTRKSKTISRKTKGTGSPEWERRPEGTTGSDNGGGDSLALSSLPTE